MYTFHQILLCIPRSISGVVTRTGVCHARASVLLSTFTEMNVYSVLYRKLSSPIQQTDIWHIFSYYVQVEPQESVDMTKHTRPNTHHPERVDGLRMFSHMTDNTHVTGMVCTWRGGAEGKELDKNISKSQTKHLHFWCNKSLLIYQ